RSISVRSVPPLPGLAHQVPTRPSPPRRAVTRVNRTALEREDSDQEKVAELRTGSAKPSCSASGPLPVFGCPPRTKTSNLGREIYLASLRSSRPKSCGGKRRFHRAL